MPSYSSLLLFCVQVFCLVACVASQQQQSDPDPNVFCFKCQSVRNHKDLYANPNDCHTYFQCFYFANGTAQGFKRNCRAGTFWHEQIMQCMPEGDVPCTDLCLTAGQKCYSMPNNCASYFVCSSGTSYPFCCPQPLVFNATSCQCVESSQPCLDTCVRPPEVPPTTAQPPEDFGTYCIDSWGNKLRGTDNPAVFQLIDSSDDTIFYSLPCAAGTTFSSSSCECSQSVDYTAPSQSPSKECTLYLPFDGDSSDYSAQHFYADVVSPAALATNGVSARGSGSLVIDGLLGRVEIPAMKNSQPLPATTTCLFFRCLNPPCTYDAAAGIATDRGCPTCSFGFSASLQPTNIARAEANCTNLGKVLLLEQPLPASLDYSNFIQICKERAGNNFRLYVNQQLVFDQAVTCDFPLVQCPLLIGFDPVYGSFQGYIDEYLTCPFAIGQEGVDAHYQGQNALRSGGYIP